MQRRRHSRFVALAILSELIAPGPALCDPAPATAPALATEIARIDLAKPFHTLSAWRLVATQGPPTGDVYDDPAPGAIRLCLEKDPVETCASELTPAPGAPGAVMDGGWEAHYLPVARPVYPRGRSAPPLLLIVMASLHAGNGSQAAETQLFDYSRARDRFERIYDRLIGTNTNAEVRFISRGPLEGAMIAVEPTSDAPYAYWVEVDRFTAGRAYRRVLRYRSATRYGDGNPLAVIDSEMPNIERRLGLWRPGSPLPLPMGSDKPCPRPRLKRGALWCD